MASAVGRDWRVRRREKILAAATRLFGRTTFELVQMEDVAAAAEVGKATLYRYFPSKDGLYLEVCTRAFQRLEGDLKAAAKLPPQQALAHMITALIEVMAEQVASIRLLSGDRSPVAEGWRSLYYQQRRFIIDMFRVVLEEGISQGEFRAQDTDVASRLLLGMVRGGLATAGGVGRADLTRAMIDMVLNSAGSGAAQ
jgi:AcrR family transcriptional regulator